MPRNAEMGSDSKYKSNQTVEGFRLLADKEVCFVVKPGVKIMTLKR
jgi:hypothetical protein